MDEVPSLEEALRAIDTLHNDPNPGKKESANLWLKKLQESVHAWKISDQLLHHEESSLESRYFAAQTMRSKIQQSFEELPEDAYIPLRNSLMDHISKIDETTNTAIVKQLCVALADLILQMTSWEHSIRDLFQRLGNNSEHQYALLEILTVLPEEISSRHLMLGSSRRDEILKSFTYYGDLVLRYLIECPKNNKHVSIYCKILKCSETWITIHAISLTSPLFSQIITLTFEILQNDMTGPQLHEAAADWVCAVLQILEEDTFTKKDPITEETIVPIQKLQLDIFSRISNLEQAYHMSVAHEDMDKSVNYCRIFTELAETFLEIIVYGSLNGKQHYALKALDFVLMCVSHYDYEVAQITFNFWYRLSDLVYHIEKDELTNIFKSFVERLIFALSKHCQMEPDHLGLIEEDEGFAEFRAQVFELIKDVVFVVGSSHCFRQTFNSLTAVTQGEPRWEVIEAALFVMKALAKDIRPEENDVVPKLVEAILNLPSDTHIAVKHTGILVLGELCEWINHHPQTLEMILNFLLNSLSQINLGGAASHALHSICTACSDHMMLHFQGLLQIAKSIDNFDIDNNAAENILKGVVRTMSRLPNKEIIGYMKELCLFQAKPLSELMTGYRQDTEQGSKRDPIMWLDRLSAIFSHASPTLEKDAPHPCREAAEEIWPVLSNTFSYYQQDVRITERCCRCMRFLIRCLGTHSAFLLERLVGQMVALYTANQYSCFLYLGSILVDEFGSEEDYVSGLLGMLEALIVPTFMILELTDGLQNHPDTVDDLFRLCTKFILTSPVQFLHASMINSILDCALLACCLSHREANASVMKFFGELIHSGRRDENKPDFTIRRQLLENILREKGQTLVTTLLRAVVFSLPPYTLSDIANIIIELNLTTKEHTSHWLRQAINQVSVENAEKRRTIKPNREHKEIIEFYNIVTTSNSPSTVEIALGNYTRLYR